MTLQERNEKSNGGGLLTDILGKETRVGKMIFNKLPFSVWGQDNAINFEFELSYLNITADHFSAWIIFWGGKFDWDFTSTFLFIMMDH